MEDWAVMGQNYVRLIAELWKNPCIWEELALRATTVTVCVVR